MPQINVIPNWRATYPTDAKYQKPPLTPALTVTLGPSAVPNKHTYVAGTVQEFETPEEDAGEGTEE